MDSLSDPAGRDLILPPSVKDVTVRLARPDERRRWDATMAERHPLGFRGFAGRGLRYIAEYGGCWLALLGWQSGAFKCRPRDLWIGWRQREQFPRLHLIANNTRMLMLWPPGTIRNLASCVMAANLRRLSADWQAQFGHPLELAEALALDCYSLLRNIDLLGKVMQIKHLLELAIFLPMPLPRARWA